MTKLKTHDVGSVTLVRIPFLTKLSNSVLRVSRSGTGTFWRGCTTGEMLLSTRIELFHSRPATPYEIHICTEVVDESEE